MLPATHPFEEVTIDLAAAFPKTKRGYDSVFTLVDWLPKLITFVAYINNSTAAYITYLLFDNMVYKLGMPKKTISNHNPGFVFEY